MGGGEWNGNEGMNGRNEWKGGNEWNGQRKGMEGMKCMNQAQGRQFELFI